MAEKRLYDRVFTWQDGGGAVIGFSRWRQDEAQVELSVTSTKVKAYIETLEQQES